MDAAHLTGWSVADWRADDRTNVHKTAVQRAARILQRKPVKTRLFKRYRLHCAVRYEPLIESKPADARTCST